MCYVCVAYGAGLLANEAYFRYTAVLSELSGCRVGGDESVCLVFFELLLCRSFFFFDFVPNLIALTLALAHCFLVLLLHSTL